MKTLRLIKFNPLAAVTVGTESKYLKPPDYLEITGDKETDLENLETSKSYDIIMIGEDHTDEYCNWFVEEAIKIFEPDYILTEHVLWSTVQPGEFKQRLANLGNDGLPKNKFTAQWLEVWDKYQIPVIGMDYKPKTNSMKEFNKVVNEGKLSDSFYPREKRMIETLLEYSKKGRVLLQVGDTHMRSSPEFFKGNGSPLRRYGIDNPDKVIMFRLAKAYQEMP